MKDLGTLAGAIERHKRGALMFSGGKDSIAIAHALRDYSKVLELVWVNTGAMFEHMAQFVRDTAERYGYKLVELKSDQAERFRRVGFPVRIVPIYYTPLGVSRWRDNPGRMMLTDNVSCCADLRSRPIGEYMTRQRLTLIIHGQRLDDNCIQNFGDSSSEIIAPLWNWTEAEVFEYIAAHKLELPEQYAFGYESSVECWNCPADPDIDRIKYLRERHPEKLRELRPLLEHIYGSVIAEWKKLEPGLLEAAK